MLVPGMLYLAIFFLFPTVQLFFTSLYDPSGSFIEGYTMTWHFANYAEAWAKDNPASAAAAKDDALALHLSGKWKEADAASAQAVKVYGATSSRATAASCSLAPMGPSRSTPITATATIAACCCRAA